MCPWFSARARPTRWAPSAASRVESSRPATNCQSVRLRQPPRRAVPSGKHCAACRDPSNLTDACYPYGSIQVPGGPEPIVLHRDAVSGGGYFMVGTVISADMDLIGQLQPNTPVRFVKVEMDQALAARKVRAELLAKIRSSLTSSP